jgi:hypothetical protein
MKNCYCVAALSHIAKDEKTGKKINVQMLSTDKTHDSNA